MEICLYCGREYDPRVDPGHEDECLESLYENTDVEVKPDPTLTKILEGLLDEDKEE